jgi:hypothetical protein
VVAKNNLFDTKFNGKKIVVMQLTT